jgi:hypothetical protein
MKVPAYVALLTLLSAACGNSSHGPDTPSKITIRTGELPALIAARDEVSAEWTIPATTAAGTFEIEVTGPYRVVVACKGVDGAPSATLYLYAQTPDDAHLIEHTCVQSVSFPFHVRGRVPQEGMVSFGGYGHGSSGGPWSFDLPAAAGVFDLVALFGSFTTGFDRVTIRRDITVSGDLDLGTISTGSAHSLIPTRFTASNLDPNEMLRASSSIDSGHTLAVSTIPNQPEHAWEVRLAPEVALRSTDTQRATFVAEVPPSSETAQQRQRLIDQTVRPGGPTSLTLMEPLLSIQLEVFGDRLRAAWTDLPEYDGLGLLRDSFPTNSTRSVTTWGVFSRSFIDAVGVTSLELDFSDVPGFNSTWKHDPTFRQIVAFHVMRHTSPDAIAQSGVFMHVPVPRTTQGTTQQRIKAQAPYMIAPWDWFGAWTRHARAWLGTH